MSETTTSFNARDQIHRDLNKLGRDRAVSLFGFIAILGTFLGLMLASPASEHALERNVSWYIALLLLFGASAGGAALTVGVPLLSRERFMVASAVTAATMIAALLLVVDFSSSGPADPWGAGSRCFVYCTIISGLAMLALGFLSGRLWRRFPNPGWMLALGLGGVGLSALHMQCGGSDPVHLFVFHLGPVLLLYGMARALVWLREYVLQAD